MSNLPQCLIWIIKCTKKHTAEHTPDIGFKLDPNILLQYKFKENTNGVYVIALVREKRGWSF